MHYDVNKHRSRDSNPQPVDMKTNMLSTRPTTHALNALWNTSLSALNDVVMVTIILLTQNRRKYNIPLALWHSGIVSNTYQANTRAALVP